MANDEDILAQISVLAGQINRHKNGQPLNEQMRPNSASRGRGRGGGMGSFGAYNKYTPDSSGEYFQANSGWRGRGGYPTRGYARGGRPQVHRHRSLVLNGTNLPPPNPGKATPETPSFVTKTDRHLQLINTSVFEKESLSRAKALEESRKQMLKRRNEKEKTKLQNYLRRAAENPTSSLTPLSAKAPGNHVVVIDGIRFSVVNHGSKLVKVPGDPNPAKATPKVAYVGGVQFHRSKNGNLIRHAVILSNRYGRPLNDYGIVASRYNIADKKRNRKAGVVKKVNVPCTIFGTTGSCPKGPQCRYIHDPSRVAVCKVFLMKGSCPSGDSCDLSHDLTPERTPACLHFARGMCSNSDCRFTHVRVSPNAPVCRAFGLYGYCEKGLSCDERHVHECPDFSNTGKCTTKGCKLPHREKASIMRTNSAKTEDGLSDLSSDDDDEPIDSDDVDSDLDDEFMGSADRELDLDFIQQEDFVEFS